MSRLRAFFIILAVFCFIYAIVFAGGNWGIISSWLWIHTGTGNEPGSYYGFFSGFGSDLGEYVIILGVMTGLYHLVKRNNCHAHGCWRVGSFPVGDYRVCRVHHAEITGTEKMDIERLKVVHHLHKRKRLLDAGYKTSDGTTSQGKEWSP
jgi:hypothetical protein